MDSGESFLKKLETDLETGNTLPDDRRGICKKSRNQRASERTYRSRRGHWI